MQRSMFVTLALAIGMSAPAGLHSQTEQTREGWHVIDRQDAFAMNLGGTRFGFIAGERP